MGFVVSQTAPSLMNPGASSDGMRFSGTPAKARMILAILAAVLAFGLTAVGYGLWQMVTGRRSKRVIYFVVGIAALLVLLALVL